MNIYAQVYNNRVVAVSQSPNKMIEVDSEDIRLLGVFYVDGEFVGYKITLTSDKSTISADGQDTVAITATVTTWDDQPADISEGISFVVDGVELEAVAVVNGVAELEYAADEPGKVTITAKTDNPYILHYDEIEVAAE